MLAITSGAPEHGWQRQHHLIDSLAYVDTVSDDEKHLAQTLIQEEMRAMGTRPEAYLKEMPRCGTVSCETSSSEGRPSDIRLDTTRYDLPSPSTVSKYTETEYRIAVDNARAQLEHQKARVVNLQLLQKYGPVSWRAHNEVLGALLERTREELETIVGDSNHINRERSMEQTAAAGAGGSGLEQARTTYVDMVEKNARILRACTTSSHATTTKTTIKNE